MKQRLKNHGKDVRISDLALITRPELVSMRDHIAIDAWTYISHNLGNGQLYPHSSKRYYFRRRLIPIEDGKLY